MTTRHLAPQNRKHEPSNVIRAAKKTKNDQKCSTWASSLSDFDPKPLTEWCFGVRYPGSGHPERGIHDGKIAKSDRLLAAENAGLLRDALLDAARDADAVLVGQDRFGQRFEVQFVMIGPKAVVTVRTGWIVRTGETFPRLTTCSVD